MTFLLAASLFFNGPAPMEMPRAQAFLVKERSDRRERATMRLEDRFDKTDLWISRSVDGMWRDADGREFMLATLGTIAPPLTGDSVVTRADYVASCAPLLRKDDKELVAVVMYRGTLELFSFGQDGSIRQLSQGMHDINSFQMVGDNIYASQVSMQYPATIYAYNLGDEKAEGRKLSTYNDAILSQVRMGRTEPYWIKTVDGKEMLTWLIYPYDYDSTKTYPALLFCEGGPQNIVSQFWSTRWNFEVMSGAGYFVIAPNRRGCPGFGMEWLEEISGDYGGLCMQDYMSATDYFANNFKNIDRERIGACGASFGGYSIYWLAGHNHDVKGYEGGQRFKAFLAHNGMFNFEQQYLETEEMWFENWDLGGPYWESDKNPKIKKSMSSSTSLSILFSWFSCDGSNSTICSSCIAFHTLV